MGNAKKDNEEIIEELKSNNKGQKKIKKIKSKERKK